MLLLRFVGFFFSFLSLLGDISLQDGAMGVDLGGSIVTFVCGYGLLLKLFHLL